MLKLTTLILGTLISISTIASTHGGGVLIRNAMIGPDKEIIFNMGQKDGVVKFAYGQLIENKWQVQEVELPIVEVEQDQAIMRALLNSRLNKNWSQIQ